jgi:hypothetical protein
MLLYNDFIEKLNLVKSYNVQSKFLVVHSVKHWSQTYITDEGQTDVSPNIKYLDFFFDIHLFFFNNMHTDYYFSMTVQLIVSFFFFYDKMCFMKSMTVRHKQTDLHEWK